MGDAGESWTTGAEDDAVERLVLIRVLDLHPAQVSVAELVRELFGETAEFTQRDAVERATQSLAGAGLLHHGAELVSPTRAALRFDELLERD